MADARTPATTPAYGIGGNLAWLAIVRLNGRNASTWSGAESAAERFNYEHSNQELLELAPPIAETARRAAGTHAPFNNCYRDIAQRNAATMTRLNETEV